MPIRTRLYLGAAVVAMAIAAVAFVAARPAGHRGPMRPPPRLADAAGARSKWLGAAEAAYDHSRAWWDPARHWYRKYLGDQRLVTLWHVVHLFSVTSAIAIADPTPAHNAAARKFANAVEGYWNPALRPVPGYGPGRGKRSPTARTWYDDDAWLGVAFFDAFRATGNHRYLRDADRALTFVNSGWDPRNGGIYWDNRRTFKSSESLAGATLTAASLYGVTHNARYLALARRYIGWADRTIKGSDGLYGNRATAARPMPYIEGPMAEAMVRLCDTTGTRAYCTSGEDLMRRTAARFPTLTMGPQYDSIYIRSVVQIYGLDRDRRWLTLAQQVGKDVLANAAEPNGLLLRSWQGQPLAEPGPPGRLQIHGASTSVLAWLAAARR